MTDYPYAQTKKSLKGVLDKIPEVSVPKVADKAWLASLGFTNSNDHAVISVLRFLGFVDKAGRPTERWQSFRNGGNSGSEMASALRNGYAKLFKVYPNAEAMSRTDLHSFFAAGLDAGTQVINRRVTTFKTLTDYADFEADAQKRQINAENGKVEVQQNGRGLVQKPEDLESEMPTLHIDIQVHIAADAPESQIDKIFESMAKHLYGKTVN